MVDRLTAVVDDLEKNKLGKFKGWAVPGKTLVPRPSTWPERFADGRSAGLRR